MRNSKCFAQSELGTFKVFILKVDFQIFLLDGAGLSLKRFKADGLHYANRGSWFARFWRRRKLTVLVYCVAEVPTAGLEISNYRRTAFRLRNVFMIQYNYQNMRVVHRDGVQNANLGMYTQLEGLFDEAVKMVRYHFEELGKGI